MRDELIQGSTTSAKSDSRTCLPLMTHKPSVVSARFLPCAKFASICDQQHRASIACRDSVAASKRKFTNDKESHAYSLSMTIDESIVIGDQITITILEVNGNSVRIGIDAPPEISVHRNEVYDRIRDTAGECNTTASTLLGKTASSRKTLTLK